MVTNMKNKSVIKVICLVLAALTALSFYSCESKEKTLTISIDELFEKIQDANAEGILFPYDVDRLYDDFLITEDLYSEGYFKIPLESAGVETIAFFKATSRENAGKIKAALDMFVNDTKTYQEKYNADNYAVAKNAVTKIEGNYVYLVMSPKKNGILKIINEYLS